MQKLFLFQKLLNFLKAYANAFVHLFFPHICLQCGSDDLLMHYPLCEKCINTLPSTDFFKMKDNPVEKIFWGRVHIESAGAALFFTKESLVQTLIFELKYKHNKKAGILLGRIMGIALSESGRFEDIEGLIPIPITIQKQRKRSFNQAEIICQGIVQVWPKKIISTLLLKSKQTVTQTKKDRIERASNNSAVFHLSNESSISNKHLLLVDDVITTGTTLEAAYCCLINANPSKISIATAAYTL